jgi:hypothetical protein
MIKNCHCALAVKYYFMATWEVAEILKAYFKIAFPEEYLRYQDAFEAGIWEKEDTGPWLGRVIVYKLQVGPHQDRYDGGPTAIFNVGQYSGGDLYLPDLGLKLLYVLKVLLPVSLSLF